MQYQVIGTRRENGEHVEITIDAPDLRAAELQAGELGIVITKITRLSPAPLPPILPLDIGFDMANTASLLHGLSVFCFILTAVFGLGFIAVIAIPRVNSVALPLLWVAFNMLIFAALTGGLSSALKALRYIAEKSAR